MSWTFHAPTGTYRDHALSTKIRHEVIADVQFPKFATIEPGYGKNKGQSVTITRILALDAAGRVSEMDKLPSGRPAIQTKSVDIAEWGFKIPWSNYEAKLTHYELPPVFEMKLREQMSLTQDGMVATAAKLTPIRYRPMLAGGVITTNGAFSGVSDKNLDVSDLRVIHDYMRQTLRVPYFRDGKYKAILSTRAARGIKNDPIYEAWQAPTGKQPFVTGQFASDIEGFDLIQTNNANALADLAGTSTVLGEAMFFGADAFGMLMVQEPDIAMSLPLQDDLGRFREVGWFGIMEAFLVWEVAATARAIYVGSS